MGFGEELVDKLPVHCKLHDGDNLMRNILIKTVGAWLDDFDNRLMDFFNGVYLSEAENGYLSFIGENYNIPRKMGESDVDYRKRIIYELLGHITIDYLVDIYDIEVYCFISDFNVEENTLTCDNPYMFTGGFMLISDENTRKSIEKKIVLDSDITWLII